MPPVAPDSYRMSRGGSARDLHLISPSIRSRNPGLSTVAEAAPTPAPAVMLKAQARLLPRNNSSAPA
eukprot:CAMPEP_0202831348 /NCGR_PEP_ID=MMETSP1389-20130828/16799_1 /ASSEMBLY_ACC=CAM_ASM_000865 /TAXON_ID=302021 /ORGANISM="Rhodomonas sp., Strain CCMP768" /LENGTH=66 /DNA_ID=CAMNT_0049505091 /DNA_START=1 /DNA_END=198 /DNA_ORIENTATION=-